MKILSVGNSKGYLLLEKKMCLLAGIKAVWNRNITG